MMDFYSDPGSNVLRIFTRFWIPNAPKAMWICFAFASEKPLIKLYEIFISH
jgi:hypothetical protein